MTENTAKSRQNLLYKIVSNKLLITGLGLLLASVIAAQFIDDNRVLLINGQKYLSIDHALCSTGNTLCIPLGIFTVSIHLLQEIGFAIIIAYMISRSIDRLARSEFNELANKRIAEIQKSVFRSTYGRNLTEGVLNEVEQLVLDASFLRHNHRITYHLTKCHAHDLDPNDREIPDIEIIVADVSLTYETENITSTIQNCPIRFEAEKPPYAALCKYINIESVEIDGTSIPTAEFQSLVGENNDAVFLSKEVPNIRPHQRVRVHGKWREIKLLTDTVLWKSLSPSDGMTLCVHFPLGTEVIGASAVHRLEITRRHLGPTYREWVIEGTVLPLQGIVVWWRYDAAESQNTRTPELSMNTRPTALLPAPAPREQKIRKRWWRWGNIPNTCN